MVLFALFVLVSVPGHVKADAPPPMDAYIYGTVTVNGTPVTGPGYMVFGGGDQSGLDGGEYFLTIPGGGSGSISVLKDGAWLTVTNGQFSVAEGEIVRIDLQVLDIPVVDISTFNATPSTIAEGGSAVLSWSISNADYASINNGVGSIYPQSGSVEVTPLSTTSYTLTASNAGGSVTRSVTITVEVPESHSYYIPYYRGDDEYVTAVALRNSSGTNVAHVTVTVYDQGGSIIETEVLDPVLSARSQRAYVLRRDLQTEGWIRVDSDQKLTGFSWAAKLGDDSWPINMADVTLIPELSTTLIVPHVAQDDNWYTTIYVSNPNNSRTTVTLTYVDQSGMERYTMDYYIPANGSGAYELSDLLGAGEQASDGSVEITANRGVAAFALYYDTETRGGTCYAGISAVDPTK